MIVYKIKCKEKHEFDVWFRNSKEYYGQHKNQLISCPHCGSVDVSKALMSPNISTSAAPSDLEKHIELSASIVIEAHKDKAGDVLKLFENTNQLKINAGEESFPDNKGQTQEEKSYALKELQAIVKKSCHNVGRQFPKEVRKMYYGETKKRNIYGQASTEEIVDLYHEGIEVIPLPAFPKEDA